MCLLNLYRERYIPITRQSVIRYLTQDKDFLSEEEKKLFPGFVHALDAALVSKYQHVLEELKVGTLCVTVPVHRAGLHLHFLHMMI